MLYWRGYKIVTKIKLITHENITIFEPDEAGNHQDEEAIDFEAKIVYYIYCIVNRLFKK
jgi:hypothetical protein